MRQFDADAQIGTHEFGSSAGVFLVVFAEADHELIEAERIAVVQIKLNKPRSATLVLWCCGAVVLWCCQSATLVLWCWQSATLVLWCCHAHSVGIYLLSCALCLHLLAVSLACCHSVTHCCCLGVTHCCCHSFWDSIYALLAVTARKLDSANLSKHGVRVTSASMISATAP